MAKTLFFDADKDGDEDLFIGPAGNREPSYSRQMQCRLLVNDGKGNFSLHETSFPQMGVNVEAAVAEDIDNDGDLDLFVWRQGDLRKLWSYAPRALCSLMMEQEILKILLHHCQP
jgi:hypothetical protein